ncbi:hypothetical protein [Roseomonas sp. AR75]|jgi:hypothetical protein|nr:hypothetical protein [Roseomonas sp. AR75]
MSEPPRRRRFWILAALLLVIAAVAAGLTVHADRQPQPVIVPYDPLPRW